MSKTHVWQKHASNFIVRDALLAWLLCCAMMTAGCAAAAPATGGSPLSPTPDLTATAATVVLNQALTGAFATETAAVRAIMTATTLDHRRTADATHTMTATQTPTQTPTATATHDSDATAAAHANAIETGIAATLTAQPSRTPTATPMPTATPTTNATAIMVQVEVEVTLAARPTATPLPAATTPPTLPPPTLPPPVVCAISVAGELSSLWNQAELGCPVNGASIVWSSWTPYERGMMMWRSDTNHIYGFFNSVWWQAVPDIWDGQSSTPSRGAAPPGLLEPIRGTGHIWGTNDTFFRELGWARAEQKGFCALVQSFERGFLLRSSTVASCKDGLFNHAQGGNFPLDALVAVQSGGWRARLR